MECQQEDEAVPAGDQAEQAVVDQRGLPGWDKVAWLAAALVSTKGLCVTCVTAGQVAEIVRLGGELVQPEYDSG